MKKILQLSHWLLPLFFLLLNTNLFAQKQMDSKLMQQIEAEIEESLDDGDIPGLSLVILKDGETVMKNYGFANVASQTPVTSNTLFEIGSNSKAFTALAAARLIRENKLDPEALVSDYLPWFKVTFEDQPAEIKVTHLIHHTSGIPWNTISKIPASEANDALEQTVRALIGEELEERPGKEYLYATINYDVLALLIEVVSQQPFETYLENAVIKPLELNNTSIGVPTDEALMSKGYRISFFKARPYDAPRYKGNNAAGYVISNAKDMALWLQFQMGLLSSDLYDVAAATHERDETVALHGMSSYAQGWEVALDGTNTIHHGGLNPNFTSFIAFRPDEKIGVVLLANSNSNYTFVLGENLMTLLGGEEIENTFAPGDNNDKMFTGLSAAMFFYILVVLVMLFLFIVALFKKERKYEALTWAKVGRFFKSILFIVPFLLGVYILPTALAGFSWESILVWTPFSFEVLIKLILGAIAISYFSWFLSLVFPNPNEYKRKAPSIVLMSILSGLSNVILVIMVTSAINSTIELKYLLFYYTLVLSLYLLGRKYVQISLIKFTRGLIYDLKVQLIQKIFSTSYQKFEKIDRGRIYTALNDDVNVIGQSTSTFVSLITNIITTIGAFAYLASIAFWAACLTIILIISLATIYYFVGERANVFFEEARDESNVYMRLLNGMVDGFKEISLHRNKKIEYKDDVATSADRFRTKISTADIRFVNAFLVGESLLVVLLGIVAFGIQELFPGIEAYTVMSFVIILLYLIGPINGILGAVPGLLYLNVAWNRIQEFLKDIPANLDLDLVPEPRDAVVKSFEVQNVQFTYEKDEDDRSFGIGPINLKAKGGELLFIIGGNGSGKTTLAKLLTGLYQPDQGELRINGKTMKDSSLGEYFSTVFSPSYLFEKLYNVDDKAKSEEIDKYLKVLQLNEKVSIENNRYSTIDLSGGQRKRLALLQCYMEDSPIYLFDEWAADQDPGYRKFFYRTLLPEMKKQGKIVIAITHDDHYFDVADQVLEMKNGILTPYSKENSPLTLSGLKKVL